ncbi:MAG: hypothetical protein Q7S60_00195 [bacterium]|nr:hypothetical protein [bacterium]
MNTYLLASDFDNTIAETLKPSPAAIGVEESTASAIKDVFGDTGLRIYRYGLGGLQNRSPSELVGLLLDGAPPALLESARTFLDGNLGRLSNQVPDKKGVPLVWNPDNPDGVATELFVRQKLSYSLRQIGKFPDETTWPQPYEGFLEFWKALYGLKDRGLEIHTAVISSGHELFIQKTFSTWELPLPDILITEDDIRGRKYPLEMERRIKPGQLPMALAHLEWLRRQKLLTGETKHMEVAQESKRRMIFFGDDPARDGKMAINAGIAFGLFAKHSRQNGFNDGGFIFSDWRRIAELLAVGKALFDGRSIAEILDHQTSTLEGAHASSRRERL